MENLNVTNILPTVSFDMLGCDKKKNCCKKYKKKGRHCGGCPKK